jgi:hypothetical protein
MILDMPQTGKAFKKTLCISAFVANIKMERTQDKQVKYYRIVDEPNQRINKPLPRR